MTHWSLACTSGDGEDDTQDHLQYTLLPVELVPIFAAAAAPHAPLSPQSRVSPPGATQYRVEHADLSEYTVPLEAMPRSSNSWGPPGTDHMVVDSVATSSGSSDLAEFEAPMAETGIRHEEVTTPDDLPTRWVRSCVGLLGYARGWVPEPSPAHSTMLYSLMQVGKSLEAKVVHGPASTEQT